MESSFDVRGKEFRVNFSLFGLEKYYFNGVLLKKRRTLKFNDRVIFDTDEGRIEIVVALSPNNWSTKAFLNNELIVEELFPEVKNRIQSRRKPEAVGKLDMFKKAILWCVLVVIFFLVFQWLKHS